MISEKIQSLITDALKAKEETKLSTLRMLSSALNYERIALQRELTDEEELNVVRKEVKKRKDAVDAYNQANLQDRALQEETEMKILQQFLPPAVSKEDIEKAVDEAIAQTGATAIADMGKVMGMVKGKLGSNAEGSLIAEVVKAKLA